MSDVDMALQKTGSEFRASASNVPERDFTKPRGIWPHGFGTASIAAVFVAVLFVPIIVLSGSEPSSPVLREPADVTFEGEGWILGLHERIVTAGERVELCWEFQGVGVGINGGDVVEEGCASRDIPSEGTTISYMGGVFFELDESSLSIAELRPGDGGQVEVRTGRKSIRYDGQRMPLSGADVFLVEFDRETTGHSIRHIPPLGSSD